MAAAARAFGYAALFIAAMEGAIAIARFGGNVTTIWIASAVLAWALVAAPKREWPVVLGFAAVAHVLRAAYWGDPPATEAVYLLANIGGPLAFATLARWRREVFGFDDRRSVFWFLLCGGLAGPAVTTLVIGGAALTGVNPDRFTLADVGTWYLTDALSYLVFVPVMYSFARGGWRPLFAPAVRMKAAVLFAILVASLASEWFMTEPLRRAFPTLLVPYLIYMAFELGMPGARGALVVSTVGFLAYALLGSDDVRRSLPPTQYLFQVQIYLAVLVACLLPLAAALAEKQRLYESASEALADAQSAWGELIAAEAHYRLVADNARDMVMRVGLDGAVLFASPACRFLSEDVHALEGRAIRDLVHADDQARVQEEIRAFTETKALDQPHAIRARLRSASGDWRAFDIISTLVASRGREPEEIIAVLREAQA